MNRYSTSAPAARTHRTASTSSPSISGGAGTAKRATSSGGSTTRSWRATAHNPVRMLWVIPREKLEAAAADPEFLALYDRAIAALDAARAARNTWWAQPVSAARRDSRSPTSRPSSRCISRCRSTPAASACSPAITARKPATSACRSSASASCIRRATSTSTSRPKAGRKKATSGSTGPTRRSSRR